LEPKEIIWRSGCIRRWHNSTDHTLRESGDTVAAHSQRVALLIGMLHPLPPAHLLMCALTHDVPEIVTGDMPAPAKAGVLGEVLELTEDSIRDSMSLPKIKDEKSMDWLKMCDMLDAYLWVRDRAHHLALTEQWAETRKAIMVIAEKLGVSETLQKEFGL